MLSTVIKMLLLRLQWCFGMMMMMMMNHKNGLKYEFSTTESWSYTVEDEMVFNNCYIAIEQKLLIYYPYSDCYQQQV